MVEEFQNNFTKVNDDLPADKMEAYNLLVNYKTSYKPPTRLVDDSEEVSSVKVGVSEEKFK